MRSVAVQYNDNFASAGCAARDEFLDESALNEEIDWKYRVTNTHSSAAPSIKRGILGYASKIGRVGYTKEEIAFSGRL
mgnify:CR=1 FL=1